MGFDYLYFLRFFYLIGYYKILNIVPMLYSRLLLLFILYTVVCICLSHTPDLSLPHSLSHWINTALFSMSVHLFSEFCVKTPWTTAHQAFCPWDSPSKNTRVDCHALLQGIFPTQGSNPGLLLCRQIFY